MIMTDEQKKLVEANIGLVWHSIKNYVKSAIGDDDVYQIGCMGLIKAAQNYDPSRSSFATFAVKCIVGEIYKYFRHQRSVKETMNYKAYHMEDIIYRHEKDEITLLDAIELRKRSGEDEAFTNLLIQEAISVLHTLPDTQYKSFLLYYMQGFNQPEIARMLDTSQAQISRYLSRATKKLKEYFDVA